MVSYMTIYATIYIHIWICYIYKLFIQCLNDWYRQFSNFGHDEDKTSFHSIISLIVVLDLPEDTIHTHSLPATEEI